MLGLEGYGGSLYGEIQCIMGDVKWDPPHEQTNRQTQLKTLPNRNFVGGW